MTSFIDRLFEQILWIEMKLVKFITRLIIDQSTHGETPQRTGRPRLYRNRVNFSLQRYYSSTESNYEDLQL